MGLAEAHATHGARLSRPPVERRPPFADGDRFRLPEIRSELPVCRHPSYRLIESRGLRWARTYIPFETAAQRERFVEEAHCVWTCLLFPGGSPRRVQDICDLTLLLFATDDAFVDRKRAGASLDDARRILAQAAAVMHGAEADPSEPWVPGLRDIWGRLVARMPPRQLERIAVSLVALYRGAEREVAVRIGGDVPPVEDYMRLRKESVGAKIYLALAEYAIGTDMTAALGASSAVRELHDVASEHLILTNDLFSFRKEHYDGDAINAVTVMRHHAGLGLQEVVNELCQAIEGREREFIAKRDAILDSALGQHDDIRVTLRALGYLLSGNLRWSYLTPRYHGAGYRWNGSTSGEVGLYPDRTVLGDR